MDCRCSLRAGLIYCWGICGLGGISEGETTELREEPSTTLGLLPRLALFGFSRLDLSVLDLSPLGLSILDLASAIEDGCEVLDVADFQPFRIDLRVLSLSFSGGGGGLEGTDARGSSANCGLGDGRAEEVS